MNFSSDKKMHRLLYFSQISQTFPLENIDQDKALKNIIVSSVYNNKITAVTGILLVCQKWFIQALEGSAEAIMTTYNRISLDHRHCNITVIEIAPSNKREFDNWNMCARRISTADDEIIKLLDIDGQFNPHLLTSDSALKLLVAVRDVKFRNRANGDLKKNKESRFS